MKPEHFAGYDLVLGAPPGWDADVHGTCAGLPVMRHDGVCTSCWSATWRERLSILFGKRIWVQVVSGETQPPISLTVDR